MKLKTNKFLAVLCTVAMIMTMIVPMFAFAVTAADETQTKYTFSSYAAGTQYAANESHVLDETLTVVTTECHFTSELRIYSSSTHDGYAILKSSKPITALGMNAGNKVDTIKITGSNDEGATWTDIGTVATTATSYKDYTASGNFGDGYLWIKLDVSGSNQVRLKSITVTYASVTEPEPENPDPSEPADPSIKVTGDNYTAVGANVTLQATVENVTGDATVAWESSDDEIATVVDGVVTPVAMGKVTITATVGEISAQKEITVYPAAGVITVAEALQVCAWTGANAAPYTYSVTGTIQKIDEAYNKQYNNITVTVTDGTASIKAYRMKGGATLMLGQMITVTGSLINYGGNTPEFNSGCTYVNVLDATAQAVIATLNEIQAYSSLGFRYSTSVITETVTPSVEVTDTLDRAFTGVPSATDYVTWSGKAGTSGAVYAGQSAGDSGTIQLRSKNSNSGIVTTVSGGKATKVVVTWNTSKTSAGRTLEVYGSNTAYTAATDLYGDNKGTKLGTIVCGTSTELVITGDYAFIGLRSNSGAMYLDNISITWESAAAPANDEAAEGATTVEKTVYDNSKFSFRFAVDSTLGTLENVQAYGIYVTTGDKTVTYTEANKSWTEEDDTYYVTINLGDIINDTAKLSMEFTVRAFVVIDDVTYISEITEVCSVASIVADYYEAGEDVENLYDYLDELGLI